MAALLPLTAAMLGNSAEVVGASSDGLFSVREAATGLQTGVVGPTAAGKTRASKVVRGIATLVQLGLSQSPDGSSAGGAGVKSPVPVSGSGAAVGGLKSSTQSFVLTHATPQALLRVLAETGGVVVMFGDEVKASLPGVLDGLGSVEDTATLMECMTGNGSIDKVSLQLGVLGLGSCEVRWRVTGGWCGQGAPPRKSLLPLSTSVEVGVCFPCPH